MKSKAEQEILRIKKQASKLPPLPKKDEELLDKLAELLADDFWEKFNSGKLQKPGKRGK